MWDIGFLCVRVSLGRGVRRARGVGWRFRLGGRRGVWRGNHLERGFGVRRGLRVGRWGGRRGGGGGGGGGRGGGGGGRGVWGGTHLGRGFGVRRGLRVGRWGGRG